MRVELRDGQWAELRERITHGQDKVLKRAYRRSRDEPDARYDFDTLIVRIYVTAWAVVDPEGARIDLADADAIDRAPDDIIDTLLPRAIEQWTGAQIPNPPTPPSSEGSDSATE